MTKATYPRPAIEYVEDYEYGRDDVERELEPTLTEKRRMVAAIVLRNPQMSINDIAVEYGFSRDMLYEFLTACYGAEALMNVVINGNNNLVALKETYEHLLDEEMDELIEQASSGRIVDAI